MRPDDGATWKKYRWQMETFNHTGLPAGWRWMHYEPSHHGMDLYVLEGDYPTRGNWLCVWQAEDKFHIARHGGISRSRPLSEPDVICDTLEEAKAVSLAMIRLNDEGNLAL